MPAASDDAGDEEPDDCRRAPEDVRAALFKLNWDNYAYLFTDRLYVKA